MKFSLRQLSYVIAAAERHCTERITATRIPGMADVDAPLRRKRR